MFGREGHVREEETEVRMKRTRVYRCFRGDKVQCEYCGKVLGMRKVHNGVLRQGHRCYKEARKEV